MTNLTSRVVVAVIAIPGIIFFAWIGGWLWAAFVAAVGMLALLEYAALWRAKGAQPQTATMVGGALALLLVFLHERTTAAAAFLFDGRIALPLQWQAFIWIVLLLVLTTLTAELFRNAGSALLNTAATILGVAYIGLFLGAAAGMREIFTPAEFPIARVFGTAVLSQAQAAVLDRWGGATVIAVLASIWMCDTAAYFGGRTMGRHLLFPRVSPKKTWEGAVWGFFAAVLTMIAARHLALGYLSFAHAVVLGAAVGIAGQIGDLVESLMKRDAGVKDSSAFLPGHGGIFDRFDSLLFVSPVVFLYLDFVVFA